MTEIRCPVTELLTEQCAHCRPASSIPTDESFDLFDLNDGQRSPWIEARFDGRCAGCGWEIYPGDVIRANGAGGWLCGECGYEQP